MPFSLTAFYSDRDYKDIRFTNLLYIMTVFTKEDIISVLIF